LHAKKLKKISLKQNRLFQTNTVEMIRDISDNISNNPQSQF